MKYLNKIIFINSANISYAEVAVDGNVHFTGTQGVGKSTVLRALLFFYNADKHKLGIQHGQKPFDEFYFRQANSYILYEVMRDNGAYTDYSGINVPLVAVCNVPPVAQCNVPPQKWLQ